MNKAKSRLERQAKRAKFQLSFSPADFINYPKQIIKSSLQLNFLWLILAMIKKYFQYLPTLLLALPFYYASYFIFTQVHPQQIQNFLLINSYLPLQFCLLFANFFFFSFLLLNTRRALLLSLYLAIIIFLRLQQVILSWQLLLGLLIFFVIIELIVMVIKHHFADINKKASLKKGSKK